MPEQPSRSPLAIAVTVCAVGLLLSLGLCGVGAVIGGDRFAIPGFFLFLFCSAALVLVGIISIFVMLIRHFRRGNN